MKAIKKEYTFHQAVEFVGNIKCDGTPVSLDHDLVEQQIGAAHGFKVGIGLIHVFTVLLVLKGFCVEICHSDDRPDVKHQQDDGNEPHN